MSKKQKQTTHYYLALASLHLDSSISLWLDLDKNKASTAISFAVSFFIEFSSSVFWAVDHFIKVYELLDVERKMGEKRKVNLLLFQNTGDVLSNFVLKIAGKKNQKS